MTTDAEVARGIAADLFTDGANRHAERLAMEYSNGPKFDTPGLCEQAVADRLATALSDARKEVMTSGLAADHILIIRSLCAGIFRGDQVMGGISRDDYGCPTLSDTVRNFLKEKLDGLAPNAAAESAREARG